MTSRRIDHGKVRIAVRAVLAAHPEGKDPKVENGQSPHYLSHGKPCCLVAYVLVELGFSLGLLKDLDKAGPAPIRLTNHPLRHRFTPVAWALLGYLQDGNDCGLTWKGTMDRAFTTRSPYGSIPPPRSPFWTRRPWMTPPEGK